MPDFSVPEAEAGFLFIAAAHILQPTHPSWFYFSLTLCLLIYSGGVGIGWRKRASYQRLKVIDQHHPDEVVKLESLQAYPEPDSCVNTASRMDWDLITTQVTRSGNNDGIMEEPDELCLGSTSGITVS